MGLLSTRPFTNTTCIISFNPYNKPLANWHTGGEG